MGQALGAMQLENPVFWPAALAARTGLASCGSSWSPIVEAVRPGFMADADALRRPWRPHGVGWSAANGRYAGESARPDAHVTSPIKDDAAHIQPIW